MSQSPSIDHQLTRYRSVSTLLFVALLLLFFLATLFALMELGQRYRAVNASAEILARLEARSHFSSSSPEEGEISLSRGSPFLEGPTVTVASAALLQRTTAAITSAGGSVISSETEPQGTQSKDGYLRIMATCELEQGALQTLLFDIEAGMPFLFVDQLVAQTATPASKGGRMQVLLGISGLWRTTK
jgi:general secretion pathway protein M